MPVAAAVAGSVIGGAIQASGARSAARAQERAANEQIGLQREVYDSTTQRFQPYLQAGNTALAAYQSELGLGKRPDGYTGFQATPGYQFQLDQGLGAVNALAGARGGLVSGRTMQELQTYGQGLASQEYGNHLNRLAGMTDMGQASAGNMASAGNAFAAGAGQAIGNRGNAQAAGAIGQANAWSGAIQNGIGAYQYQSAMRPPA